MKMQVVVHAGAHMTDEGRLVGCLLDNRERFSAIGTEVPAPGLYRKLLRDMLNSVPDDPIGPGARDAVLGAIAHDGSADRLVLSNQAFFGTPKMAVGQGQFYPVAELRIDALRQIFTGDRVELFLALRNPATLLPALFAETSFADMTEFLNGTDPMEFRWSDMIARLRTEFPDLAMTIWCNEDTPLIWSEVVREIGGLEPTASIDGEFALIESIMTDEGAKRFRDYVAQRPDMSEIQKRRVIVACLDKFARPDAIEEELDLPGWTMQLIEGMTDLYDEDIHAIQRLPGVTTIIP